MAERRTHERYPIWFPVIVERATEGVLAICRDASGGGALISAVAPLTTDEVVRIKFRLDPREPDRVKDARVVRVIDNEDELLLAFPYRIALEFVTRDEKFPDDLREHAHKSDRR